MRCMWRWCLALKEPGLVDEAWVLMDSSLLPEGSASSRLVWGGRCQLRSFLHASESCRSTASEEMTGCSPSPPLPLSSEVAADGDGGEEDSMMSESKFTITGLG